MGTIINHIFQHRCNHDEMMFSRSNLYWRVICDRCGYIRSQGYRGQTA